MACILEILFELAMAPVTCFMNAHLLFTYMSFTLREDTAFKCLIFLEKSLCTSLV